MLCVRKVTLRRWERRCAKLFALSVVKGNCSHERRAKYATPPKQFRAAHCRNEPQPVGRRQKFITNAKNLPEMYQLARGIASDAARRPPAGETAPGNMEFRFISGTLSIPSAFPCFCLLGRAVSLKQIEKIRYDRQAHAFFTMLRTDHHLQRRRRSETSRHDISRR